MNIREDMIKMMQEAIEDIDTYIPFFRSFSRDKNEEIKEVATQAVKNLLKRREEFLCHKKYWENS